MVKCVDCNKKFEEDEIIKICSQCDESICDDCKDNHNCVEDYVSDYENQECAECGELENDMKECEICSEYFCSNCIEGHMKSHIEFEEYDYDDYVQDKVKEKL